MFLKVWSPIEKNLEEIWKIEGYTRDAESPTVTHFRCILGSRANIFLKFFASVQVDEVGESPKIDKKKLKENMGKLKVKRKQVLKILKDLSPNKAAGIDKMSPKILKEVAVEIAGIVT